MTLIRMGSQPCLIKFQAKFLDEYKLLLAIHFASHKSSPLGSVKYANRVEQGCQFE